MRRDSLLACGSQLGTTGSTSTSSCVNWMQRRMSAGSGELVDTRSVELDPRDLASRVNEAGCK